MTCRVRIPYHCVSSYFWTCILLYKATVPHHSHSFALYILAMIRHSCLAALLALLAGFGLADHPENGVDKYLTVRRIARKYKVIPALTHRTIEA